VATIFETETCGRCGGGGHYSYNPMNGTRCFGCGGTGLRLTKRGKAAKAFLSSLLQKPISEIRPGDNIIMSTGSMGLGPDRWHYVVSIKPSKTVFNGVADRLEITYKRNGVTSSIGGYTADTVLESVRDNDALEAARAKALAYQATLTKAGKPAKTKLKASA